MKKAIVAMVFCLALSGSAYADGYGDDPQLQGQYTFF